MVDKDRSHVVEGYHRTFQESGAKPVSYHYLMYRRTDYSRADYLDYYVHSHYKFGLASPLAYYYQNYLDLDAGRELAELFVNREICQSFSMDVLLDTSK